MYETTTSIINASIVTHYIGSWWIFKFVIFADIFPMVEQGMKYYVHIIFSVVAKEI